MTDVRRRKLKGYCDEYVANTPRILNLQEESVERRTIACTCFRRYAHTCGDSLFMLPADYYLMSCWLRLICSITFHPRVLFTRSVLPTHIMQGDGEGRSMNSVIHSTVCRLQFMPKRRSIHDVIGDIQPIADANGFDAYCSSQGRGKGWVNRTELYSKWALSSLDGRAKQGPFLMS